MTACISYSSDIVRRKLHTMIITLGSTEETYESDGIGVKQLLRRQYGEVSDVGKHVDDCDERQ